MSKVWNVLLTMLVVVMGAFAVIIVGTLIAREASRIARGEPSWMEKCEAAGGTVVHSRGPDLCVRKEALIDIE